jgi:hypothetical protein
MGPASYTKPLQVNIRLAFLPFSCYFDGFLVFEQYAALLVVDVSVSLVQGHSKGKGKGR